MVQSFNDDFTVTWQDAADALLTWRHNKDHFPRPLAPLGQGFIRDLMFRMSSVPAVFVNGYMYTAPPREPPQMLPEVVDKGGTRAWLEDYEPRIQVICSRLQSIEYGRAPVGEILSRLDGCLDEAAQVCRYTMAVVGDFRQPAFELLDYCEKHLGQEGASLAATLLQGSENSSAASGVALARLAHVASLSPGTAKAIVDGRFRDLEQLDDAVEFMDELRVFLDEYGRRPEDAGSLHEVTWAEDPGTILRSIATYVAAPDRSPAAAVARSREQSKIAELEVEQRLPNKEHATFHQLLSASRRLVPINEKRNYWQLTAIGTLRIPALALGRKLAEVGLLDQPNDVFFLYDDEISSAMTRRSAEIRGLVSERKLDLEHWKTLEAPPFLGARPADEDYSKLPPAARYVRYAFDGVAAEQSERQLIKGIGASRGVASGRARVITSLDQAARLEPGDILICVTTSPPWTPLFPVAGAIVTDTGGILSHSAICAREYAIPCVVGTGVATSRIPDGAWVQVDGSSGKVNIEA